MAKTRIAIVGLGAIGTSIGLAFRKAAAEVELVGHDKEPAASRQAQKVAAVDRTHWNLIAACESADLVILALPLLAIRETLQAIGPYLRRDCVVTDTATVKCAVAQWAAEFLPEGVHFVGGDPLVVTEGQGSEAARADLFKEANWCIAPLPNVPSEAIELVTDMVTLLGAKPYFIDAVEHDGLMAATDHLPLVLAATLLKALAEHSSLRELSRMGGAALARLTSQAAAEVAASSICQLNRENIIRWLDIMQLALREVKEIIASDETAAVQALFAQAQEHRQQLLHAAEQESVGRPDYSELPSSAEMLFGRWVRGRRPQKKE